MAGSNCYNVMITAFNSFGSVKDKYQTCVFSITCASPTDAVNDCLNVDSVCKRFVLRNILLLSSWLLQLHIVDDSLGFLV